MLHISIIVITLKYSFKKFENKYSTFGKNHGPFQIQTLLQFLSIGLNEELHSYLTSLLGNCPRCSFSEKPKFIVLKHFCNYKTSFIFGTCWLSIWLAPCFPLLPLSQKYEIEDKMTAFCFSLLSFSIRFDTGMFVFPNNPLLQCFY